MQVSNTLALEFKDVYRVQKVIINNFGPISKCEIDLAQFIVLTGAQAAGKSTIAKAIYYFSLVKEICFTLITGNKNRNLNMLKRDLRGKFLLQTFYALFGEMVDSSVGYSLECIYTEKTKIRVYGDGDSLPHIRLSKNINELIERYADHDLSFWSYENILQLNHELEHLFNLPYTPIYIPAGRSIVTLMTDFMGELLLSSGGTRTRSAMQNLDYATQKYVREVLLLRKFFSEGTMKWINHIRRGHTLNASLVKKALLLSMKIIKGEYFYREGAEFLRVKKHDGTTTDIWVNFASSGQQEILWVCNIIFYHLFHGDPVFIILEEPEAHLYPDSQKYISELIGLFVHARNRAIITTHSPYILGEFNNLLYANEIIGVDEQRNAIVDEEKILPYKNSRAFYVADGIVKDAMEENLICNALIDGASEEINAENDRLIELKWATEGQNEN